MKPLVFILTSGTTGLLVAQPPVKAEFCSLRLVGVGVGQPVPAVLM